MFVNTLRLYKRPNFSLRLEKNFDAGLVGRVSIYMVHIGSIYLVIRTENKPEVSFSIISIPLNLSERPHMDAHKHADIFNLLLFIIFNPLDIYTRS